MHVAGVLDKSESIGSVGLMLRLHTYFVVCSASTSCPSFGGEISQNFTSRASSAASGRETVVPRQS